MVRVASLSCFPPGSVTRDFYSAIPLTLEETEKAERRRRKDRARKRKARDKVVGALVQEIEEVTEPLIPEEVLRLIQRNGGLA
jgi:hypothetical protein